MNATLNTVENIINKENILFICDNFFKNHQYDIQKMASIVEGKSNITVRIIDWFVEYYIEDCNLSDINLSYKSTLSYYEKQYFDPFKRKHRIDYKYMVNNEEHFLETSVGQLNFFKWAFENSVINFIETNLPEITFYINQHKYK